MNRSYILVILLVMFLSCGNSSSEFNSKGTYSKLEHAEVYSNLNKEQKIISSKLDVFFTDLNQKGIFNGSVLVSRAGKVLFKKSLGFLNKATQGLLTDSSMFQLASVSKVITATAVLMLHERAVIDINKPFKFYFPDFPYINVNVKELLNHRSGLPNYIYTLNNEIYQPNYKMTNTDMYNYFISKNSKPYQRPNTRFNYCNTNYALLALLIEKTTGKSYSQFLKEELFTPLGMKNTATITDIDLDGVNTTKPYDTRWRPVAFDASDYVLGDKSIYSTPYDLFLFSEALYQNKIISPQTQELAYTAFSKEKKLSNYGYGWRLKDFNDPDKKEVYHNGWWHGYRSSFHRRLKDTLTVIILSNQLNRSAYQTHKVYEILDSSSAGAIIEEEE
jgi:CubicO group peptidase (beta-lactamase class C family)